MTPMAAEYRNALLVFVFLLNLAHIRAQCDKPAPGNDRILVAEPNKPPYPDGSTATFQCVVGYKPVDSKADATIRCTGNTWGDLKLQCTKRKCGPLADIPNGRYFYSPEGDDGISFGGRATAICNPGYFLSNEGVRICRAEGWDGRDGICEVVKCEPPPGVQNGRLDEELLEVYEYHQAVTYVCEQGFTLFGESTIVCSDNGTFQPSPPRCKKVSCDPVSVENGHRIGGQLSSSYGYKSFLEFTCNPGFTMEGSGYIVCEEFGWTPKPPKCVARETSTAGTTTGSTTRTTKGDKEIVTTTKTPDNEKEITPSPPPNGHNKIALGVGLGVLGLFLLGVFGYFIHKKKSSGEHSLPHSKP
ncbi:regulator of complement activation group 2 gene 1 isoform X3 [Hoplias malabaricus]|uniref:regulator of complement activation group 2 gene 1 isoform X3 n=1 Tax=Hoplias malabaricus TaxID=27720 RepID=UPI00346307EF